MVSWLWALGLLLPPPQAASSPTFPTTKETCLWTLKATFRTGASDPVRWSGRKADQEGFFSPGDCSVKYRRGLHHKRPISVWRGLSLRKGSRHPDPCARTCLGLWAQAMGHGHVSPRLLRGLSFPTWPLRRHTAWSLFWPLSSVSHTFSLGWGFPGFLTLWFPTGF